MAQDRAGAQIQQELSQPFSYFRAPTDQLGFENAPKATIVTYDGAFVSPYGQLSFYAGAPRSMRPVNARVKTLLEDDLPVIQFGFDRDGLRYDFEAFAAPAGMDPRANLITFVRARSATPGRRPQAGALGANFGDIDADINVDRGYDWFLGQRRALLKALRTQRGDWQSQLFMDEARFTETKPDCVVRAGPRDGERQHLVFAAHGTGAIPGMPGFTSASRRRPSNTISRCRPARRVCSGSDAGCAGGAQPAGGARAGHRRRITTSIAQRRSRSGRRRWPKADHFSVADPKVMSTFRTSLVNDLIAREMAEDGRVYQRVNRIHYNYFWIRDGSYFVRTYDMLGLHDLARETLNAFLVWQDGRPVGFFKPGAPQPAGARLSVQDDYWGQVLWAMGAHIRTTGDRALLEQIYPLLGPHVDEFVARCAKDPRGLWPVAGPYDNEEINGHYTGHSFWALLGLKYAVSMAREMGRTADAARWQQIHDDYRANFLNSCAIWRQSPAATSPPAWTASPTATTGRTPAGASTRSRRWPRTTRSRARRWRSSAATTIRKAS